MAREMAEWVTDLLIWSIPCRTALVTVDREKKITAEAPSIRSWAVMALPSPKTRRIRGEARTNIPTAQGLALIHISKAARSVVCQKSDLSL